MRTSAGLGLGLGMGAFMVLAFACGGSEETSPGTSSGGTEAGAETSTPVDSSTTTDSAKPLDAAFDGFIDAPEVTLTFGTCPTFAACGGDEKGSFKVSGGCLDESLLEPAKTACPGLTTENEVIKAKGTVDVDGTTIVRHTQVKLTAKAFIPFSGQCANTDNCMLLAVGAQTQLGFDKVTCTDAADGGATGGCDCDIEESVVQNSASTYEKDGSTITTANGDTFDYCVDGAKLTYTQTNGQGNQDPLPLYIELSK